MTTHIGPRLLFLGVTATLLCGQQGQVGGPLAGYAFDGASRELRAILGIPGASIVGQAVSLPFDAAWVAVSPRLDAAIAVATDGSLHVLRLASGAAAEVSYNGGLARVGQAVFSPSGSAVALFEGGKVEIVTGLPGAPQLSGTLDMGTGGARSKAGRSLALSDDGAWLLVGTTGAVRLLGTAGGNRTLMDGVRTAWVAFAPGSHDAAVLAPGSHGLVLIRDAAGTASPQVLAADDALFTGPAGLAFAADGQSVLVAGAGGAVAGFALTGGTRSALACDCNPTGLTRMGNVFRLNELGAEPMWLVDPGASTARIVFVPAQVAAN